jgi:hypothetical protein
MEQNAKQLLKRISEKVETLTDNKISQVAHAPIENEWRAYIWQKAPWKDIAWRVKEPNIRGEAEVHLGFYSSKPDEDLSTGIDKTEMLAKGKVSHLIKNENGIRLVWKVNFNELTEIETVERTIMELLPEFIPLALSYLIKSSQRSSVDPEKNNLEEVDISLTNSLGQSKFILGTLSEDQLSFLEKNKGYIKYSINEISPEWLDNKDFIYAAINQNDYGILGSAHENLRKDKDLALFAVRTNSLALRELHESLLADLEFVKELCGILDWKEVINNISYEIIEDSSDAYRAFFEQKCKEGINAYRNELNNLSFNKKEPVEYKDAVRNIFEKYIPNQRHHLSAFTGEGKFYYDENGKISGWGSDDLLYPVLAYEFMDNIWRPAMHQADLETLVKMIPATIHEGKNTFIPDQELANWGYHKVIEYLDEGESLSLNQLFELLNACEEFFNLPYDLPEVHQRLVDEVFNYSDDEVLSMIDYYEGYYFLSSIFNEDKNHEYIELLKNKISDTENDDQKQKFEYLLGVMENGWEW